MSAVETEQMPFLKTRKVARPRQAPSLGCLGDGGCGIMHVD